jgi:hypothetical protein
MVHVRRPGAAHKTLCTHSGEGQELPPVTDRPVVQVEVEVSGQLTREVLPFFRQSPDYSLLSTTLRLQQPAAPQPETDPRDDDLVRAVLNTSSEAPCEGKTLAT